MMETTIITILLIVSGISGVGGIFFIGFNSKKWWVWLFVLGGFLSGLLGGLLREDLALGLKLGAIFAGMILFSGFMTRWWRIFFQGKLSRS